MALKETKPDLRILYLVVSWKAGGWIFSQMVKTRETRRSQCPQFLKDFGFDDLDLYWLNPTLALYTGQPTDPENKTRMTSLVQELKTAFASDGLVLTVSAAAALQRQRMLMNWTNWLTMLTCSMCLALTTSIPGGMV